MMLVLLHDIEDLGLKRADVVEGLVSRDGFWAVIQDGDSDFRKIFCTEFKFLGEDR